MPSWFRFEKSLRRYVLAASAAAFATCGWNAHAATFTFDGATLDLDALASSFSLSTSAFPASFGPSAFIGAMAVDFSGNSSGVGVASGSVSGGGVTTVGVSPGGGPGGQFDFRFTLGSGGSSDRLTQSEAVNFQATGLGGEVTNVALHLQGLNPDNFPGGSLWLLSGVTATPVPEPGSYALFLLGLIGLGFMMRKSLRLG